MLNKVWPAMIIISIFFGFCNGRIGEINDAIYESFDQTIEITISFLGIMCFWNGMIKILENTSIMGKIKKILKPVIDKVFYNETEKAKDFILINVVSDILGIGNAATPIGIEAMKEMEKENSSDKLTYGMNMFILLNSLSIQILPTTIISIRASLGSNNAGIIIVPVLISTLITLIVTMLIGGKVFKKEEQYENF